MKRKNPVSAKKLKPAVKRTVMDVESFADNGTPYKTRRSLRVKGIVGCLFRLFFVFIIVHLVLVFFICYCFEHILLPSQPAVTCSKLTIETLEQDVKYVQS